jgi:hypothetical protein
MPIGDAASPVKNSGDIITTNAGVNARYGTVSDSGAMDSARWYSNLANVAPNAVMVTTV